MIVNASLKVLELLAQGDGLRKTLKDNAAYFRTNMEAAGFTCAGADHAIEEQIIICKEGTVGRKHNWKPAGPG